MKLWEIFRFEINYQSRRASTWIYFAILLLLTRYVTMELSTEFASSERFFFHAPFIVAAATILGSLIGLLIAAALAGDAGTRDVHTRMDPLLYTSPVSKGAHLAGRFLAAFGLQALILLAVPLALLLAAVVPPPDARLVGPFRPIVYLTAYAVIALPNAFIATAFLFSIAALSRRAMVSYLGALLLGGACAFSWAFVAATLGRWQLAKLLDPFGATVLGELSMLWTPAERSTRLIGPQGSLLLNRVLWIGIAFGTLALTHRWYRLAHHAPGTSWQSLSRRSPRAAGGPKPRRSPAGVGGQPGTPIIVPSVRRTFGFATHARQTLAIAQESFRQIMANWGAVALAAIAARAVASGLESDFMGVPLVATAERVTAVLSAPFPRMIVPLLITFYAGELIWRERDLRLSEITDAAPIPEWVSFLGKLAGLSLVLVTLQAVMVGSGMVIQALWNHYDFEIALYARILFGLQLVDYLLFAVLACVVHALVNHKYVGHLLFLIAYMFMTFRGALASRTTCSSTDRIRAGRTRTCAASNRSSGRGSGSSSIGRRGRCCWR